MSESGSVPVSTEAHRDALLRRRGNLCAAVGNDVRRDRDGLRGLRGGCREGPAEDFDLAIKLLNAVIDINPDFVEAWNRRSTIHYMRKDYGQSLVDIQQVLVREPRHFGALAGLGMIMQELGDEKRALEAFRKALAVNPYLEKVPELVKTLTEKVEGRDI